MSLHSAEFASAVSLFLLLSLSAGAVAWRRARRLDRNPTLEQMLAQLVAVDRDKVATVASDAEDGGQAGLEGWQVWELVGGLAGLEALAANCDVLVRLAHHVQQWYPEALPVAEQLRLNAREIQWHLERLQGAASRGNLQAVFPDYAQRAVTIYYAMTQHVVSLYAATQVPGWTQLQGAL